MHKAFLAVMAYISNLSATGHPTLGVMPAKPVDLAKAGIVSPRGTVDVLRAAQP
jgi:hypothetical protein